jgi:hypothetical protein
MASKTTEFSQTRFQDALIATINKLWHNGGRKAIKATMGKARRQLQKMGYSVTMAYAITDEAHDLWALEMDAK